MYSILQYWQTIAYIFVMQYLDNPKAINHLNH